VGSSIVYNVYVFIRCYCGLIKEFRIFSLNDFLGFTPGCYAHFLYAHISWTCSNSPIDNDRLFTLAVASVASKSKLAWLEMFTESLPTVYRVAANFTPFLFTSGFCDLLPGFAIYFRVLRFTSGFYTDKRCMAYNASDSSVDPQDTLNPPYPSFYCCYCYELPLLRHCSLRAELLVSFLLVSSCKGGFSHVYQMQVSPA
jgi:hypothetical protein